MRDFDWIAHLEKRLSAPYQPEREADNFDKTQANNEAGWKNDDEEQIKEHTLSLQESAVQAQFDGYHYYPMGGGRPIPFSVD